MNYKLEIGNLEVNIPETEFLPNVNIKIQDAKFEVEDLSIRDMYEAFKAALHISSSNQFIKAKL